MVHKRNCVDVGLTPLHTQRLEHTDGEIGVEIEVEGVNLPTLLPPEWRVEGDASLRGVEACEYVLKQPLKRAEIRKSLDALAKKFTDKKSKVEDTGRAGVHVHINFQEVPLRSIATMACLYFMYEEAMTSFCGENRTGNLFCLGTKYAENVISVLTEYVQWGDIHTIHSDNVRYASLNLKALATYGSLEFRSMRGTIDMNVINDWINILLCFKDAALELKDPQDILHQYSYLGHTKFTRYVFKEYAEMLMNEHIVERDVREGMWRVQPLCYARDWEDAQPDSALPKPYLIAAERNRLKMVRRDVERGALIDDI